MDVVVYYTILYYKTHLLCKFKKHTLYNQFILEYEKFLRMQKNPKKNTLSLLVLTGIGAVACRDGCQ